MNERLNQLRLEAGISRLHDEPKFMVAVSKEGTVIEPLDGLEKFAELIVQECIQNIRDNMEIAKVDTLGDKDLFLETLRTSGHFYITELERHFGVKE